MTVNPMKISHDAAQPVAYRIGYGNKKVGQRNWYRKYTVMLQCPSPEAPDGVGGVCFVLYLFIYFYWSILIYHIVILYDISHMWNLKNNTNECIHKTVTDSQTNLWLSKEIGNEERQIKGMGLVDTNQLGFFFNCFYSFLFFSCFFKLSLIF